MTSVSNGVGTNKILLGKLNFLPQNLRANDTYAVFNQVRTLNVMRFSPMLENNCVKQCKLDDALFEQVQVKIFRDMVYQLEDDEKINILRKAYIQEKIKSAENLAYKIIKIERTGSRERIPEMEKKIYELLRDVDANDRNAGIKIDVQNIFNRCMKNHSL